MSSQAKRHGDDPAHLVTSIAVSDRLGQRPPQNGKRKMLRSRIERFRPSRELPLNLILLITSWLDDVGDISRVTRTSKLLYYMTLPRLWEHITLRSYSGIRYKNGSPEGFGGGSPFTMALEALVTRQVAQYAKTVRLVGEWREVDKEQLSLGRVPDNTMMLNIVVRAALDKCANLGSFSWELNVKPSRTVYVGLAALKSLQSLTLRLPVDRVPQPISLVPAISTLRYLHVFDIDPLCYPDDLSLLLASCTKLETLKLEWSPRMRAEKDPSVVIGSYFGRAAAANTRLPLRHLAFKNLYTRSHSVYTDVIALDHLQSLTLLNCTDPDDPKAVFLDATWKMNPPNWSVMRQVKKIRFDVVDSTATEFLVRLDGGLEEVYTVNNKNPPFQAHFPVSNDGNSPTASAANTTTQPPPVSRSENAGLAGTYIAALTSHHGPSLRILLLAERWILSDNILNLLVRSCPNLEQLAAATESSHFQCCKLIAQNLPKLWAFRALSPAEDRMIRHAALGMENTQHVEKFGKELIGREVWKPPYRNIRCFGLGMLAFEFGKTIRETAPGGDSVFRREVKVLSLEEAAARCELFGMDSMSI